MSYDSILLVKQVPDTANVTAEAMKEDGTVNRGALPAIFNPEDLHALETALEVRDRYGGTVTALTHGPPKAADVLRECLYRGADRAILLTDRRAAASDTLATSYILTQAVKTIGRYDFVFCGRQAIDGDTAQVGPQCAEKLGIPQITYLEQLVHIADGRIRIRRNIGNGWEIVEAELPVLITVTATANQPRPPAAKRVMRFKRARAESELAAEVKAAQPRRVGAAAGGGSRAATASNSSEQGLLIEQWNLDDIGADLARCGLAGSPTKVFRVQSIVLTKEGYTEIPPTEEGIRQLIHELVVDRTLGINDRTEPTGRSLGLRRTGRRRCCTTWRWSCAARPASWPTSWASRPAPCCPAASVDATAAAADRPRGRQRLRGRRSDGWATTRPAPYARVLCHADREAPAADRALRGHAAGPRPGTAGGLGDAGRHDGRLHRPGDPGRHRSANQDRSTRTCCCRSARPSAATSSPRSSTTTGGRRWPRSAKA